MAEHSPADILELSSVEQRSPSQGGRSMSAGSKSKAQREISAELTQGRAEQDSASVLLPGEGQTLGAGESSRRETVQSSRQIIKLDNGYIFGDDSMKKAVVKIQRCGVRVRVDSNEYSRQEEDDTERGVEQGAAEETMDQD